LQIKFLASKEIVGPFIQETQTADKILFRIKEIDCMPFLQERHTLFWPQRDCVPFLTRKVSASKKEIDCAILTRTQMQILKNHSGLKEKLCAILYKKNTICRQDFYPSCSSSYNSADLEI
jgi:hypothetical protein